MSNELSDIFMIKKTKTNESITFKIKDTIDVVWMSQKTLANFFEIPFKKLLKPLNDTLNELNTNKKIHIRTISYVQNKQGSSQAIQEIQYSFFIISWLAFKLDTAVAKAFQEWVIKSHFTLSKNGFIIDKKRINQSTKRIQKLTNAVSKINKTATDQQSS